MIATIAWKNIWRNRTRSLVVVAATTIGLTGAVLVSALSIGMVADRVEVALRDEVSHIQIHHPLFLDNFESQHRVGAPGDLLEKLEALPQVEAVAARSVLTGMVSTAQKAVGVSLIGINPEREKLLTGLWQSLPNSLQLLERGFAPERASAYLADSVGSYFAEPGRSPQILISERLARELKAQVRSRVLVQLLDAQGYMTGGQFRVVGIFSTSNAMFDESQVFVRQSDLVALTGHEPELCHEIALRLTPEHDMAEALADVTALAPGLSVMDWKTLKPDLGLSYEMLDAMLYIMLSIILMALGFGIVNTMLMVVLERVKELGMLMAIGMNKKRIFAMIMLETVGLSLTGGLAGMLLSALLVGYLGQVGVDLSAFGEGLEAVGYSAIVYPRLNWDNYLGITLMVILTGVLASIYPALKALSLKPAEAVRSE